MTKQLGYRRAGQAQVLPARAWWPVLPAAVAATLLAAWALSGSYLPLVLLTWITHAILLLTVLIPATLLGLFFTTPTRPLLAESPWPDALRLVLALALGLGALALTTLALGSAHLLNNIFPPVMLVAATALGIVPAHRFVRAFDLGPLRRTLHTRHWLLLLAALPVATLLVAATFPPLLLWFSEGHAYDVLEYHLALPKAFVLTNSTAPLANNVYSYLPANVEMLYTLLFSLARTAFGAGNELAGLFPAQLLHAFLMLLTAAAIALLPFKMSTAGRLIAALLFLATPWVIVTGSLAYNEGGVLLFGTLALGLALTTRGRASIVLIGVLLGLCVGCKMTAGVMVAVPIAAILLAQRRWLGLLTTVILASAMYAPWAIRAAIGSGGNPLFPVAAATLGHDGWDDTLVQRFARGHTAQEHGIAGHLQALAEQTVLDPQYSPNLARVSEWIDGPSKDAADNSLLQRFGFLWLAVPIALVLAVTRGVQAILLAGAAVLQVVGWLLFTHLQARFLLPAMPVTALLFGFALDAGAAGVGILWARRIVALAVGVQVMAAPFILGPEVGNSWPYIGQDINLRGEDFWLTDGTFPDHKKLLLIGEARSLYLKNDALYYTVFDRNPLGDALRAGGAQAALAWMKAQQVDLVVVNLEEIKRLRRTYGFDDAITDEAWAALEAQGLRRVPLATLPGIVVYEVPR